MSESAGKGLAGGVSADHRRYGVSRFAVVRRAGVAVLFAVAICVGALAGVLLAYENDLPQVSSLEDFQPNIITQVFASDDKTPIGEFAIEKRVIVTFK